MSIEHPPSDNQVSLDQLPIAKYNDNSRSLNGDDARHQAGGSPYSDDDFRTALAPMLEEADGLQEEPRQETNNILLLLEENARLRKLAVKLSNLLGDLPARGA